MSKSLINRATSDDHTPPNGFTLKEIAAKCDESIEELQIICDTLMRRLDKNKPAIKIKCLRIVKYTCENGKSQFQQAWQRNSHILRQCAQFRGVPDAVYGDSLNEQVRQAARMCLESVNNNDIGAKRAAISAKIKAQSMGSAQGGGFSGGGQPDAGDRHWAGSVATPASRIPTQQTQQTAPTSGIRPGSGRQMQGFGNDSSYNPDDANKQTWGQKLRNIAQGSGAADRWKQPQYDARAATIARIAERTAPNLDASINRSGHRKKGGVGGAWGAPDQDEGVDDSGEEASGFNTLPTTSARPVATQQSSSIRPAYPVNAGPTTAAAKASDGTFERQFVQKHCGGQGRGAAPSVTEVSRFVQQFNTMDEQVVCQLLEEKLKDGNWKSHVKVLTLLLGVMDGTAPDTASTYFSTNHASIRNLTNASRKSIRNKAVKLVELLGLSQGHQVATPASVPNEPQPAAQQSNLLDFGISVSKSAPTERGGGGGGGGFLDDILGTSTAPTPVTEPPQSGGGGLLSGLSISDPQPASQAPAAPADPLDFLSGISNAPPPQPVQPAGSGFDFLQSTQGSAGSAPAGGDLLSSFGAAARQQAGMLGGGAQQTSAFGLGMAPSAPQQRAGAFGLGMAPQQQSGGAFGLGTSAPANTMPSTRTNAFGLGGTGPGQQMSGFGLGGQPPAKAANAFGMAPQQGQFMRPPQSAPQQYGVPRVQAPQSSDPFSSLINQSSPSRPNAKAATPTKAFNRGPKKNSSDDKFSGLVDLNAWT